MANGRLSADFVGIIDVLGGSHWWNVKMDWLQSLGIDFRQAQRSFRRSRGLTTTILITLSASVAVGTTVFALINGFLFHPLPYDDASRMSRLWTFRAPHSVIEQLRTPDSPFESVALYRETSSLMSYGDHVEEVQICRLDEFLLPLLGTAPLLGSLPFPADIRLGKSVALISESVWRSRFGADVSVIGRTIEVDGSAHRIIGVMPRSFTFEQRSDIWIPLTGSAQDESDTPPFALVKLRPGVTHQEADRYLGYLSARLRAADSSRFARFRIYLAPDMVDRGRDRPLAWTLVRLFMGSTACVFLIVCANISSLMIARVAKRRGETATMAALGATSTRIARQHVIESLLLVMVAALGGLVLSTWCVRLLVRLLPPGATLPGWVSFHIDIRIALYTAGLGLIGVTVFGMWPARIAARSDIMRVLQAAGNRSLVGSHPSQGMAVPIIMQVALSLILVVAAVSFAASYSRQANVARGFDTVDLYQVRIVDAPGRTRTPAATLEFFSRVKSELRQSVPGADIAFASRRLSPSADQIDNEVYLPSGQPAVIDQSWRGADVVSDDYFEALRIPIIAGRSLRSADATSDISAAVVSQRFAAIVWQKENALGKRLFVGKARRPVQIIGVSGNRRALGSSGGETAVVELPEIRLSARQGGRIQNPDFLVRSTLPGPEVRQAVQRVVRSLGMELPVSVTSVDSEERRKTILARSLAQFVTGLAFGGVALSLLGIYGVVAFDVEHRVQEIGVRRALGASSFDVLREVTRRAMRLVAVGLGTGLVCLVIATPMIGELILGNLAAYAVTSALACLLFIVATVLASVIPARRALVLSPASALRA